MADLGWMKGLCGPKRADLASPVTMEIGGRRTAVAVDGVAIVAVYEDDSPFPAPRWPEEASDLITRMLTARVEGVGASLSALRSWCGVYVPAPDENGAAYYGGAMPWWRPGLVEGRPVNRNLIARALVHLKGGVGRMGWRSVTGADQVERHALYIDRPYFWRLVVMGLSPGYVKVGVPAIEWKGGLAHV